MSILSSNSGGVPSNSDSVTDSGDWHQSLRTAIRTVGELRAALQLPADNSTDTQSATTAFSVFAPREFVARMEVGNPRDPLLLQVLPAAAEAEVVPGFVSDPVGDLAAAETSSADNADSSAAPQLSGMLKKYHGRALLVTTGACAVHCRYCFRRHFPYGQTPRAVDDWQPAIDRIASDPSIEEVILSGGDPLTLRDDWLAKLVERLAAIPHVSRLRVHTRLPIMIPSRITDALLGWLADSRLVPVMVIHANHAHELKGGDVETAIARLVDAGVPVLNQAVLLKGVNDGVDALEDLSRQLMAQRVMPYYLHQLDRVAGAAHFEVSIETGKQLIQQLRTRLPGYMVPRYVIEEAGERSKTIIA